MNQRTWKIVGTIDLILMIGIFCVSAFGGGCNEQVELASGATTFMKCHWTFVATTFTSIIGCASTACSLFAKTKEARRMTALLTVVTCIVIATLPTSFAIGVCAAAGMDCQGMAVAVWVMSACAAILSIVQMTKADPKASERPKMQL